MSPLLDTLQILYLLKQERLYQALVAKSVILVGRQKQISEFKAKKPCLKQTNKQKSQTKQKNKHICRIITGIM